MKINLARFIKSGDEIVKFKFNFVPAEDMLDVDVSGEAAVEGCLLKKYDAVILSGKVSLEYTTQCDRCLAPIRQDFTLYFEHRVITEADDEYPEAVIAENDLIIEEAVTDDLILNIPLKHICGSDCMGLCPECGANLNSSDSCGHIHAITNSFDKEGK